MAVVAHNGAVYDIILVGCGFRSPCCPQTIQEPQNFMVDHIKMLFSGLRSCKLQTLIACFIGRVC